MKTHRKDENIHAYRALADAIVIQACEDYRSGYRSISLGHGKTEAEAMISDALSFFRSDWYKMIADINLDYLVARLNGQVVERAREDYLKAWKQMRTPSRRAKADRTRKDLLRFIRSRKFAQVSETDPREAIESFNEKALKELLLDYDKAIKLVEDGKNERNALEDIKSIKSFMRSEVFSEMTALDAEKLIAKMEKR